MMPESGLDRLTDVLVSEFDQVIGPVIESGVVRLRPIRSSNDLPLGLTDQQEAGTYRLRPTDTRLRFSYGVGPDSLKDVVHPPASPVWTMRRRDGTLVVDPALTPARSTAVLGARSCDLRALDILARTQMDGDVADPSFVERRDGLFLVAVDCTHPSATCFCGTSPDGPSAREGFDIAMIELPFPDRRDARYVVRAGTDRGREIVERLELVSASDRMISIAEAALRHADRSLIREMPARAEQIVRQPEHPHWAAVADRCLTCGNCTAVCPTCFCTDMSDEVSLDGETATRTRVWDSCFSAEYSHLGPGPHRASPRARYRQWLTHKLGTWHDQFGESGCVGCGRCVTWCPVGIDLTAEVEALSRPVEVET